MAPDGAPSSPVIAFFMRLLPHQVLGLLARSVLRAASRLTLRVHGAALLALRSAGDTNEKPPPSVHEPGVLGKPEAHAIHALPGTRLKMVICHPSGALGATPPPSFASGGGAPGPAPYVALTLGDGRRTYSYPLAAAAAAATAAASGEDEWEVVEAPDEGSSAPSIVDRASASLRAKLASKPTQQALRHLPMLEPA